MCTSRLRILGLLALLLLAQRCAHVQNYQNQVLDGLTVNAKLVTLSACETALGEVNRGDDVVGLTRGLAVRRF